MPPSKRKQNEIHMNSVSSESEDIYVNNRNIRKSQSNLNRRNKKSKRNTSMLFEGDGSEDQQLQLQQQQQQQPQQHLQEEHEVSSATTNYKEASLLNQQAIAMFTIGDFDEAESLLKEALALSDTLSNFRSCQSRDKSSISSQRTVTISSMPKLLVNNNQQQSQSKSQSQKEYDEGMNLFSTPIEILNTDNSTIVGRDDQLKSASLLYNIGQTYIQRRKYSAGIDWFCSAMRKCTEIIYQPTPSTQLYCNNNSLIVFKILDAVAYCHYRTELYDDAIQFYEVAEQYTDNNQLGINYLAYIKNSLAVVLFRKEAASIASAAVETSVKTTTTTPMKSIALFNASLALYNKSECQTCQKNTNTDTNESSTEEAITNTNSKTSILNRKATVYNNLGRVYYLTGNYQQALGSFELALRIRRTLFGARSIDLAVTICNLGQTHHHLDQLDEAMLYFHEFLAIAHTALIKKEEDEDITFIPSVSDQINANGTNATNTTFVAHRDLSIVVSSVASIHLGRNQLAEAKTMYEMALNSSRLAFGTTHTEVAHILNKLGSICYKLRQYDISLTYLKEGLGIEQVLYGTKHPNVVVTLMNLAQIYRDQHKYQDALVYYGQAHRVVSATKGRESIDTCDTLLSMGLMLYRLKSFSSSFDFYQEALYVQRKHYSGGSDNHDNDNAAIASTLNSLAIVVFHLGQPRIAITYFDESLRIRRKLYGNYHPDIAVNLFNLAKLHLELHDHDKASELYKETLHVERVIQGPHSKEVIQTLQLLGLLYQHNGELQTALEYFTEALQLEREKCNNILSSSSCTSGTSTAAKLLNLIGNIHLQRGNIQEMMKYFTSASYMCNNNIDSITVTGYNFYSISKLHPECAETA